MDKNMNKNENKLIDKLATTTRVVTFPVKLEDILGLAKNHLKDQYEALNFFSNHTNINKDLENKIKELLGKFNITI